MNIFFTAPLRGKKNYIDNYKKIYKNLCFKNTVFADHVFKLNLEEVSSWEPEFHFNYYINILNKIKDCECVVVEMSTPSVNIEYEVSMAINLKKNILAFCHETVDLSYSDIIGLSKDDEKVQIIRYNEDNLDRQVQFGLNNVKKNLNKRFTILLPVHIVNFLENNSRESSTPISVYLRRLIEKEMNVDK